MNYLSVCSGIEAATVAWEPLGWKAVGFSDIEPFPSAVLAHHYPAVTNFGDMTNYEKWNIKEEVNLLVGGTPCQSFSMAGLRKGLSDPRGGLMLTYLEIARCYKPRWIVWENVPGVLSANGGRDFGSFLGGLAELGYGWAYRVLDAQWVRTQRHPFAVPQRRRRVFVVGCLGDMLSAGKVLFESQSMQKHSRTGDKEKQDSASASKESIGVGCWWDGTECAGTLTKKNAGGDQRMPDKDNFGAVIAPSWPAETAPTLGQSIKGTGAPGYSNQELFSQGGGFLVPHGQETDVAKCVSARGWSRHREDGDTYVTEAGPVPYDLFKITEPLNTQRRGPGDPCHTLARDNASFAAVVEKLRVRRLTPLECERLQGFPDNYTKISWRGKSPDECPEGHRYKALGNSMAVNCMEWIGERILDISKR